MIMIRRMAPGVNVPTRLLAGYSQPFGKTLPVGVVLENGLAPVAAIRQGPRSFRAKENDKWIPDMSGSKTFLCPPRRLL